jgi:hypothetical protein
MRHARNSRKTKMCRMPIDVLLMLGGLARTQGVTIPVIGDTIIREAIKAQVNKMPPADRKRFRQIIAEQPAA